MTVEQASREDYLYRVGSAEVGDKLDVELVGSRPGAILKTSDVLPERFGEDLGGAQVQVTALVKDVKARSLPDVDDEFAKTASEFDTVDQLRDDLRERLTDMKEREAQAEIRDLALQALIDTVDVDLPDTLIEEETDHRIHHARDRAERMGIGLEKMLELQGGTRIACGRIRGTTRSRDQERPRLGGDRPQRIARGDRRGDRGRDRRPRTGLRQSPKAVAKDLERTGRVLTLAGISSGARPSRPAGGACRYRDGARVNRARIRGGEPVMDTPRTTSSPWSSSRPVVASGRSTSIRAC